MLFNNKRLFKKTLLILIGIICIAFLFKGSFFLKDYASQQVEQYRFNKEGGTQTTFEVDMANVSANDRINILGQEKDIVENRIYLLGIPPLVSTSVKNGKYEIIVRITNKQKSDLIAKLIGTTAKLDFRLEDPNGKIASRSTGLSGNNVKISQVEEDSPAGIWTVNILLNERGKAILSDITKQNIGKNLALYLDGKLIIAPTIQSQITTGNVSINGNFTEEQAKTLEIELNASAIPAPIKILEQQYIKPKL